MCESVYFPYHYTLFHTLGEYRSFFKLAASATGHVGFGQECDRATIYKSFKKILKSLDEEYRIYFAKVNHLTCPYLHVYLYHMTHTQVVELDTDVQVPDPELLPTQTHKFWTGFEECELVQWLKTQISGHCGRPKTGFRLKKFWLFARFLYIFEQKRCLFASQCKVEEAFVETFNYQGADPLGPVKTCSDYNKMNIAQRRLDVCV